MRHPLVRRLFERRFPPAGLVLLGLASWAVVAIVANLGLQLIS